MASHVDFHMENYECKEACIKDEQIKPCSSDGMHFWPVSAACDCYAGYKLRSDDYIDANIKLALSAATEVALALPHTCY